MIDSQPRYTMKRLHDEIAKARAYGHQRALEDAITIIGDYAGKQSPIAAAVRSLMRTAPQEPIGYISSQTLAELRQDNSGEYKISVPHDLMNDDQFPIYVAPDAHPEAHPVPTDEPAGDIWRDGLGKVTSKPAHADAVLESDKSCSAPSSGAADQIITQIETLFPDWQSYRDLVDCIECTLHRLKAEGGR